MELFLDDELPKKIKLMIKDRFQELEENTTNVVQNNFDTTNRVLPQKDHEFINQSPSMQRIMANNPDLIPAPKVPAPVTPAAAQALANRQAMIDNAVNRKDKKARQ